MALAPFLAFDVRYDVETSQMLSTCYYLASTFYLWDQAGSCRRAHADRLQRLILLSSATTTLVEAVGILNWGCMLFIQKVYAAGAIYRYAKALGHMPTEAALCHPIKHESFEWQKVFKRNIWAFRPRSAARSAYDGKTLSLCELTSLKDSLWLYFEERRMPNPGTLSTKMCLVASLEVY